MKKLVSMPPVIVAISILLITVGFAAGRYETPVVHAQISSPSYRCNAGKDGKDTTSLCAQFIVNVSSARTGGGVFIYQVQSNPVDVRTLDEATVATGSFSGTSFQAFKPNSSTATFTLSVNAP